MNTALHAWSIHARSRRCTVTAGCNGSEEMSVSGWQYINTMPPTVDHTLIHTWPHPFLTQSSKVLHPCSSVSNLLETIAVVDISVQQQVGKKVYTSISSLITSTHMSFIQLRNVGIQRLVLTLQIDQRVIFNAVQKKTALGTDTVLLEVPIKEHPSWYSSLSAVVACRTVILPIKSAQLRFTKYCRAKQR